MIITRVTGFLNEKGLKITERDFNAIEKPKTYITEDNRRIPKNRILEVDTILVNTISSSSPSIQFEAYCLFEDKLKAKELIIDKIRERFALLEEGYLSLKTGLDKFDAK